MPTISIDDLSDRSLSQHDAAPRLRALLDATADAIVTTDLHGCIESVNPAAIEMFGYTAEEMLGGNMSMLMPMPDRTLHDGYIQRYLMTGERRVIGVGREVEAQRKDGTRFPVDLAVTEFSVDGKRMFTGLIRDISDRRAAERAAQRHLDELAHASRLADLGLTTSAIAHEINQPLAAIVSFAHACQRMLDKGSADHETLRSALGEIAAQGERASSIIGHIRAMSRKRETQHEAVDVNAAATGVLDMLATRLRDQQVVVDLRMSQELPPVKADRVHTEQAIMNLLTNALDAMGDVEPDARRITITTARRGDLVEFCLEDTGPGLDDEHAKRVFENFYSTKPHGMGVGLSISRSLVEAHGGRLWIEPTPDGGVGAHFCMTLPVFA